jgi:hypothetical protein
VALAERLRALWRRLLRRPPDEPARVGRRPRSPVLSGGAEAEPPEPYEFDDHADNPRSTDG